MNRNTLFAAACLSLAASAFAAGQHGHEDPPQHGGIVAEAKEVSYELVATPNRLQLYLRDHGQAMDVSQASARLTLLSGSDQQEVTLTPEGNRLQAVGNFKLGAGTKVVARVTNAGKPAGKPAGTVRFVIK